MQRRLIWRMIRRRYINDPLYQKMNFVNEIRKEASK
jgi:hypothetical protein